MGRKKLDSEAVSKASKAAKKEVVAEKSTKASAPQQVDELDELVKAATKKSEYTVLKDKENVYMIHSSIPDTKITATGIIQLLKDSEGTFGLHQKLSHEEALLTLAEIVNA